MNLLRMTGAWGPLYSRLYSSIVAVGMGPLYSRVVDALPPQAKGNRIIDMGCGDGRAARLIAQRHPEARVMGLDRSAAMIRRAIRQGAGLANLTFGRADALALPLADASVDLVVSLASIKHWPDRLQGVREAHRVLRAGGSFCLAEALRGCSLEDARRFIGHWRFVVPGTGRLLAEYFRRVVAAQALDQAELEGLLEAAGFGRREILLPENQPFIVALARL